jgi:hypothetical protein
MMQDVGENVDRRKVRGQEGDLSFGIGSGEII